MSNKKPASKGTVIKGSNFADILREGQAKAKAEREKFEAMSDSEKAEYIAAREKEEVEVQKILKQLGGGVTRLQF